MKKERKKIFTENRNKSGIYRWYNKITKKSYIGSSIYLTSRLKCYFSFKWLGKKILKSKSIIYNAILKYDYTDFRLDILEYCDKDSVIKREQYYIDILKPKYNIHNIAGSAFGFKHSKETKEKIRISALLRRGDKVSFYNKNHSLESKYLISISKSKSIKVIDVQMNYSKIFLGNKAAANYLNISLSTLNRYKFSKKLLKNKYLISNLNNLI